jgi:hypothetical protein
VVVLGLREAASRVIGGASIPAEFLHLHRIAQALRRLDFLGGLRSAEL